MHGVLVYNVNASLNNMFDVEHDPNQPTEQNQESIRGRNLMESVSDFNNGSVSRLSDSTLVALNEINKRNQDWIENMKKGICLEQRLELMRDRHSTQSVSSLSNGSIGRLSSSTLLVLDEINKKNEVWIEKTKQEPIPFFDIEQ